MIILDATITFLVSSALDTNPIKILVSAALFILFLLKLKEQNWKYSLSKEALVLFLIIFIACVNSVLFFLFGEYSFESNDTAQLLGIRKFVIESVFAVLLYSYLRSKSYNFILNIIYIGAAVNCIVALIEMPMVLSTPHRAKMLFFEPSSAGFYYCFSVFLLFLGINNNIIKRNIAFSFSILGLIAFSKAQFLVLLIVAIITARMHIKIISIALLSVLSISFRAEISYYYDILLNDNLQIYGIDRLIKSLSEHGIYGLSNLYDVTDTYVTRLSGIYVSIMTLFEYPFGIGVSTFNLWYKQYLIDTNLINVFIGGEVSLMFQGEAWASPRSRILEIIVASGFIALIGFVYLVKSFFKERKYNYLLYVAFLSTFIAGIILELNPILDYLVILILLLEKCREKRREHNDNVVKENSTPHNIQASH